MRTILVETRGLCVFYCTPHWECSSVEKENILNMKNAEHSTCARLPRGLVTVLLTAVLAFTLLVSGNEVKAAVTASDVEDGSYPVEVQVVSGSQKIQKATLTAEDGKLTLHLTMKGTKNKKNVSLEALDQDFKTDGMTIRVLSNSLPKGSLKSTASKAYDTLKFEKLTLPDGTWNVNVKMTGGSGRASITSPCRVTVEDGRATARIEWSSNHYDYMIVGGLKYLPENASAESSEEHSVFEIPVPAFDKALTVIGDTTAMSKPYEIEYKLTFDSDSAKRVGGTSAVTKKAGPAEITGRIVGIAVVAFLLVLFIKKYRDYTGKKKQK